MRVPKCRKKGSLGKRVVRRTGEAELLDRGRVGVDLDEGCSAAVELGPRAVDHHLLARAAALPDHNEIFPGGFFQE